MRKGLVSFIVILCMLIPLAVGCKSNPADTVTPTQMQNQTTPPDLSVPPNEGHVDVTTDTTEPENETEVSTATDPSLVTTDSSIQETEPAATEAVNNKPPRETTPPVTEEPEYTEPKPTQPNPTEPEPTTPAPTEPKPTEPKPTETPATEPSATEPAAIIDLDALVQYGLQYAADVHGYRISPGLRDGYYPAYTCVFDTMEDGKAAVRGCIDDTTRALLAVPGTQIVVEIDGVLCRARIDIEIVPQEKGTYLVSVYYG